MSVLLNESCRPMVVVSFRNKSNCPLNYSRARLLSPISSPDDAVPLTERCPNAGPYTHGLWRFLAFKVSSRLSTNENGQGPNRAAKVSADVAIDSLSKNLE
jgi:hypothetical protein